MKHASCLILLLAIIPAGSLVAQDTAMSGIVPPYEQVKDLLLASSQQMPEELYSYRPTDEVKTFTQILGHVAAVQHFFCGAVTGVNPRPPEEFELRTTKAGIIEALNGSFANCEAAYSIHDAEAMERVDFFGTLHYGNLVVYFRVNGMVPPSGQGGEQ